MELEPVAYFHSPLGGKFGTPRQSGVAASLKGEVRLVPPFNQAEALRGLEGFDYIWLVWQFHLNHVEADPGHLTVRPPRLGGNTRLGVFATRSPYRPNPLGLSSVRVESVDPDKGIIHVLGADLVDGTPIFDIKPYIPYTDSHPAARGGFTDSSEWKKIEVAISDDLVSRLDPEDVKALEEILSEDPRPRYQDDPERVYGLTFKGMDLHFTVHSGVLHLK